MSVARVWAVPGLGGMGGLRAEFAAGTETPHPSHRKKQALPAVHPNSKPWKTWRAELIGQLAFAVPATLALVLIALLALRRAQREIAAVQERRRAEAQMQDLRSELLHVSRLTAMGQMASVLAHELNQPLAAASNYLGAAKRLPVVEGSRATALVDKAGQQILRAGEIIRRLRDFVADGQLTRRPEDLGPVLK